MENKRTSSKRASDTRDLKHESSEDTKIRLLDTAERLFAERGIDGVSLRTITINAQANIASAHYYFGSKQGLIEAIFARRMGALSKQRSALLDKLEKAESVDVSGVAEAFLRPLANMVVDADSSERYYVAFLAGVALHPGPARDVGFLSFNEQRERISRLMGRALPNVPHEIRMFRFLVVVQAALPLLADLDFARVSWNTAGVQITRAGLINQIIKSMADILAGPTYQESHPLGSN